MTTPPNQDPASIEGTRQGTWLERALVTVLLLALIVLPAASALSQRFLRRQLLSAQLLGPHITLWIGFLGAVLVTLTGRHLSLSNLDVIRPGWRRS